MEVGAKVVAATEAVVMEVVVREAGCSPHPCNKDPQDSSISQFRLKYGNRLRNHVSP
jgi:hypothetical protein